MVVHWFSKIQADGTRKQQKPVTVLKSILKKTRKSMRDCERDRLPYHLSMEWSFDEEFNGVILHIDCYPDDENLEGDSLDILEISLGPFPSENGHPFPSYLVSPLYPHCELLPMPQPPPWLNVKH